MDAKNLPATMNVSVDGHAGEMPVQRHEGNRRLAIREGRVIHIRLSENVDVVDACLPVCHKRI